MKKLLVITVLGVMFTSCNEQSIMKGKKESLWVVKVIENENYLEKGITTYKLIAIDTTDFREENMWIVDSINAFQVGDTLKIGKK